MSRRHSVWIDVFAVVLFGLVLLGGAGYLLYYAGGTGSGLSAGASEGEGYAGTGRRPLSPSAVRSNGGRPSRSGTGPLLGSRPEATPSGVEAPFSASWRNEATPDLTGPFAAGSGRGVPGGSGGPAPEPSGPAIASSRPSGEGEGEAVQESGRNARSGWRAEARRLAGRTRALSNQLGQMDKESAGRKGETNASQNQPQASASGTAASSSSAPGPPDDPNKVPIGGLGWLAAFGIGYGLKRLHDGGGHKLGAT